MRQGSDLSYQDIGRELKAGTLRHVYYIRGDEDLLKRDLALRVIRAAVDERTRDFNYHQIDAAELDTSSFATLLFTPPMMHGNRLLHVRTAQRMSPKVREIVADFASKRFSGVVLLMIDPRQFGEVSARDRNPKFLGAVSRGGGAVVTCWNMNESERLRWIRESFRKRGLDISEDTARFFVGVVGEDLTRLDAEAEKLAVYAAGRESVETTDIEEVSGRYRADTVFELAHLVSEGRVGEAVQVLGNLRRTGEPPVRMIYWLSRHYIELGRLVLEKTEKERRTYLEGRSRLPRGVVLRHIAEAAINDEKSVRESLSDIYNADVAIKKEGARPDVAIEQLVVDVAMRSGKRRSC